MSKEQFGFVLFCISFYLAVVTAEFYGVLDVFFEVEKNRIHIETVSTTYIIYYNPRDLVYIALVLYISIEWVPTIFYHCRLKFIQFVDHYMSHFLAYTPVIFSTCIAYFAGQYTAEFFDLDCTYEEFFFLVQSIRSLDNALLYGLLFFLGVSLIVCLVYAVSCFFVIVIYKLYQWWALPHREE
jgi:hypothetical protein